MLKFMTTLIRTGNTPIYHLTHKKVDLAEQLPAAKTLFLH